MFFFNDTATTEIYTLSLHDALPISIRTGGRSSGAGPFRGGGRADSPPRQVRARGEKTRAAAKGAVPPMTRWWSPRRGAYRWEGEGAQARLRRHPAAGTPTMTTASRGWRAWRCGSLRDKLYGSLTAGPAATLSGRHDRVRGHSLWSVSRMTCRFARRRTVGHEREHR